LPVTRVNVGWNPDGGGGGDEHCSAPAGWVNQQEACCAPPLHVARNMTRWPGSTWNDAAQSPKAHSGWYAIATHGPPSSIASTVATEPASWPDSRTSTHHSLPPLWSKTMTRPESVCTWLAAASG